ncbi:MAG: hypothetical protein KGI37_02065 [Alphaproteobacteria bacterium]|nr:hypothetical protein [Alphaproteobacteria bacterium]
MTANKNRYFIELQLDGAHEIPRNREAEIRRAQAAHFIDQIATWLHESSMKDKVSAMAVTALGQVQITCEQDVINRLRHDDNMNIATIRQSGSLADNLSRIGVR